MLLNNLWRRFFHPEVEFQVLKSHSALELTCYSAASTTSIPMLPSRRRTPGQLKSRKSMASSRSASVGRDGMEYGRKCGRPKQSSAIPRYYSHYESFGCSAPMTQVGLLDDNLTIVGTHNDTDQGIPTFTTFSPPHSDPQQKNCVVFCFIEKKPPGGLSSAKSLGPEELTAALLAEDQKSADKAIDGNLRQALTLCHKYRQNSNFKEGTLLKSVESGSLHQFVHYASFSITDGQDRHDVARQLSKLNRQTAHDSKYHQQQGAYEELYSIVRKPEPFQSRLPSNRNAGHVIIGYKILTLDNLDRLESFWMDWSGASEIARYAPKQWHLKRITFHRQIFTLQDSSGHWTPAPDGFMYVLLCEFENLMQPPNVVMGCDLVERLRLRGCGQIGIYKVQWAYASPASSREDTPTSTADKIMATICQSSRRHEPSSATTPDEELCNCDNEKVPGTLIQLSPVISDED